LIALFYLIKIKKRKKQKEIETRISFTQKFPEEQLKETKESKKQSLIFRKKSLEN